MATGGMEIPGFSLTREIGRGAFAVVYEATQVSVGRQVALKVIAAGALGDGVEARFRAECGTVGSLSWHPNVVALYDAGISPGGSPFLAMEYLPSGSLTTQLRARRQFSPSDVIAVGLEVADALSAAHEAGVLHRDVKPDNVLIGRRGEHKLGDFGVATLNDGSRTSTSTFAGTYAYSAPELLKGSRATPASDVFSLGATLYALAAGRPAFTTGTDESPAAVMWRLVTEDPPPLPSTVPAPLREVIERSMAKEPGERYPTAATFEGALRSAAAVIAAGSVPEGPTQAAPTTRVAPALPQPAPPPGPAPDAHATPPTRAFSGGHRPDDPTVQRSSLGSESPPTATTVPAGLDDDGWTTRTVTVRVGSPGRAPDPLEPSAAATRGRPSFVTDEVLDVVEPRSFARRDLGGGRFARSIWLPNHTDDALAHLDPDTNRVVALVPVGRAPVSVLAEPEVAWSVDHGSGTVTSVDARTSTVLGSVEVGDGPVAITRAPDGIWVANMLAGTVARIGASGRVDRTVAVGERPVDLIYAAERIWVANRGDGTVSRIEPDTGRVTDTIRVGKGPAGLVEAGASVLVSNREGGSLVAIDQRTCAVGAKVKVGRGAGHPIADGDRVWVPIGSRGTLARVGAGGRNPRSGAWTLEGTVSVASSLATPVVGGAGVWVCSGVDGSVARIDGERLAVASRLQVGPGRLRLIRGDRVIWVCNVDTGQIRAIGV